MIFEAETSELKNKEWNKLNIEELKCLRSEWVDENKRAEYGLWIESAAELSPSS